MNRSYTREDYIALAKKLKEAIPDIALTTDIIVGFPGETEEDFQDTLSLVRELEFAGAYTFIFSPREGTPAYSMVDNTPKELIQSRFMSLTKLVEELSFSANQKENDSIVEVLVEGTSKSDEAVLTGHSPKNQTVLIDGVEDSQDLIGKICPVHVEQTRTWYLRGQIQGELR